MSLANSQRRALIVLCRNEVSPRFDMTAEALIVPLPEFPVEGIRLEDCKHLVLAHASGEELCDVITRSSIAVVVCGGIEEDYFHYLRWKRIEVLNDVMGSVEAVLDKLARLSLQPGDCLFAPVPEDEA